MLLDEMYSLALIFLSLSLCFSADAAGDAAR